MYYPERGSYELKRLWKNFPPDIINKVTPLMIEKAIFQKNVDREKENKDLKSIENQLKKILKKYLGKKAPSIKNLRKKIKKNNDPFTLSRELASKIVFSSEKEINDFLQLFMDFYNYSPQDDFHGRSPADIEAYDKGPWEKRLAHDLMQYIQVKIDPSKFHNQNELRKEIDKYQNKWLHHPQEELDNRSPWTVILDERKSMNNPRKDFSIRIDFTPIGRVKEDPIILTDITPQDVPLVQDLESFVQYFIENRIKVTPKNRWIPFKHLKLIEESFISTEKDSFYFMEKEETRGQEITKRYIHLIDLLCRGARFIQINKQGYLKVNQNHFQTFTQLVYGEKVFQLLMTWIEKVNWAKLQPSDFVKPYATEYQDNFKNIWYPFSQYKPNEKIKKETLLEQLYGTKKIREEFPREIIEGLLLEIERILLRYLEWFGVIAARKVKIIPEMNIPDFRT